MSNPLYGRIEKREDASKAIRFCSELVFLFACYKGLSALAVALLGEESLRRVGVADRRMAILVSLAAAMIFLLFGFMLRRHKSKAVSILLSIVFAALFASAIVQMKVIGCVWYLLLFWSSVRSIQATFRFQHLLP